MVSERKRVQTRLTREVPPSRCGWPWQGGVEGTGKEEPQPGSSSGRAAGHVGSAPYSRHFLEPTL